MNNNAYYQDGFKDGRGGRGFNPPTWLTASDMYLSYRDGYDAGRQAEEVAEWLHTYDVFTR